LNNVLANGRRWGKTHLGSDRASGRIARGEPVGWYSPTYKLLNDAWREAKLTWHSVIASKSEQEKRIELITGGTIESGHWKTQTHPVVACIPRSI